VFDAPPLSVQVVLYDTPLAAVWRQLRGIIAAASNAVTAGALCEVSVAYGDSSPAACLSTEAFAELERAGGENGLARLTYDHFDANLGSGGGSNRLARASTGPFFLVLNPDAFPDPQMFSRLLAALSPSGVAAADARQIPCEHPKSYELQTGDTSWVSGACMLVRRPAFVAVGGFSADLFPMYCDDVDLSWKLRRAGWRTVHAPDAVVFHDKRPTAGGVEPRPTERYWASLARLLLCRRWGRPDLEAETLTWLAGQGPGPYHDALLAYRQREAAGVLPEPIEGADRVAEFVDGNYAVHRY
jgi:hypothetical protein